MTHSFGHDSFGRPLHTSHQMRGRAFPDHALAGFVTSRWYKATVNESETITDAKTLCGGPFAAILATLGRS